jgi:hypothetical protein
MAGGTRFSVKPASRNIHHDTTIAIKQHVTTPQGILHQLKYNQHHHQPKPLMDQLHVAELRSYSKRFAKEEGQNISKANQQEELCLSQSSATELSRRNSHIF